MEYGQKGKDNSIILNFGMIQLCQGYPSFHSEGVGVCYGAVDDLCASPIFACGSQVKVFFYF